jgi:serine/threonine protein kinase
MSEFVRHGVMESIRQASLMQQAWRPECFRFVRTLEQAARNQGVVELMEQTNGGGFVAVKRMPVSWTARGPCEFQRDHQGETENPWTDAGVVMYLNQIFYPYVCKLHGTFHDSSETRFAYSFATHGDLFSWVSSSNFPEQGVERERLLRPIVREILHAVSALHGLAIAHCDISLENILLTSDPLDGTLKIKLIDFGMAAVGKDVLVGERGKAIYHAPEMHLGALCSPFPYDVFALGLVIFLVATTEYPWVSTRPPGCKKFKYALKYGFLGLL